MNIHQTLHKARTDGTSVFIPFIMAGDPDLETTQNIIIALEKAGAGVLELGIPFSDPVADGVTVQKAAQRALDAGTKVKDVFTLVQRVRDAGVTMPICLFTYLNPVMRMGYQAFIKEATDAGAQGALIVDLPPEEAEDYLQEAQTAKFETVFLCSPTTTPERLMRVDAASSGFVYYVSREGVTGAQYSLSESVEEKLLGLRQSLKNPVALGFGVSTKAHVAQLQGKADGIVVGSALIKEIENAPDEAVKRITKKAKDIFSE